MIRLSTAWRWQALVIVAALVTGSSLVGALQGKFYPDDPLTIDPEERDASHVQPQEVGHAYGKKPILLVRTDIRWLRSSGDSGYNPMLTEAATLRLDLKAASMERVTDEVLAAIRRLEADGPTTGT